MVKERLICFEKLKCPLYSYFIAIFNLDIYPMSPAAIAPELNTYKSTRREKIGICAHFALAAAAICAAVLISDQATLLQAAQQFPMEALSPLKVYAIMSLAFRFLLTKKEVSNKNREKFAHLQEMANVYSKTIGLRKPPKLRVCRKLTPIYAAAVPFFHRYDVIFHENLLEEHTPEQLEGILAHELVHIRKKHPWKALGLSLILTASPLMDSLSILGPAISMSYMRLNEFAADRLGAVICQNPNAMATALSQLDDRTSRKKLNQWYLASTSGKALKIVLAPIRVGMRGFFYLFIGTHPATERRIERLETMGNRPSTYKTDSWKARLARLAL